MTTPERFRRRQRIEGVCLVLLGIFSIGYFYVDRQGDKELVDCVIKTLSEQNDVLLSGRKANNIEQEADERVITLALSGKIQTQADVDRAKARYDAAQRQAQEERQTSPVPPDPEVNCR